MGACVDRDGDPDQPSEEEDACVYSAKLADQLIFAVSGHHLQANRGSPRVAAGRELGPNRGQHA